LFDGKTRKSKISWPCPFKLKRNVFFQLYSISCPLHSPSVCRNCEITRTEVFASICNANNLPILSPQYILNFLLAIRRSSLLYKEINSRKFFLTEKSFQ
jgi:hypothetical protein